jgi:PAS domain S-box-containing protein
MSIEESDTSSASFTGAMDEARFRLLVDAVEEYAIYMLDPAGRVATWNAGARRIKGYEAADIIGRPFSIFYIPEDVGAGKPERELAHAVEHGSRRDEGWRVRKDGTRFWANVVLTAVFDADGQLTGFVKITRDETDRKQADEHVRQLELLTDRERIAGELHQSIVHRIVEAGLVMDGALSLIRDPVATQRIRDAVELLDDTVKTIRTVVLDLNTDP